MLLHENALIFSQAGISFVLIHRILKSLFLFLCSSFLSQNCLIQREPNGDVRTVVADFGLAAKIKHKRFAHTRTDTHLYTSVYLSVTKL